jgi:hypothetical protein
MAIIDGVMERWHRYLRGDLPGGLDELLHEEVVFYSPIVYTPQRGREITKLYLAAAGQTLPGDTTGDGSDDGAQVGDRDAADDATDDAAGRFRYTKRVLDGDTAVLEFETTLEGKYVNGVDIIRCDDEGRIVEFRVMIRPLQAINLVHAQMQTALEALRPDS